jgi:hypothetical protein
MMIFGFTSCASGKDISIGWDKPDILDKKLTYEITVSYDDGKSFNMVDFMVDPPENQYIIKNIEDNKLVYIKLICVKYKNNGDSWVHIRGWWYDSRQLIEPMPTSLVIFMGCILK